MFKKLFSILLAGIFIGTMSVIVYAAEYGDLGWEYPLDSEYTDYFRGYSSNHLGLDLDAPKDSNIYSVDSGAVKFSGYHSSTGYYVVIANDTKASGVSNPLYVRYLHMDNAPEVSTNDSVSAGETIGYVGSYGAYIGSKPVPHLHMDVNTIKATGGRNFTTRNTIDPMLFFPDVDFNKIKSFSAKMLTFRSELIEEPFNPNDYIDTYLIKHVGVKQFDEWTTSTKDVNVQSFKKQFNITDNEFNNLISFYGISNIYNINA